MFCAYVALIHGKYIWKYQDRFCIYIVASLSSFLHLPQNDTFQDEDYHLGVRTVSSVVDPDSLNPETDTGPGFWWPKIDEKNITEKYFYIFFIKDCNLLIPRPPESTFKYRRSLQPSKENMQHFKQWNLLIFFYFCGSFLPSRIRIANPDPDQGTP